ncbi:hypothetical protein BH09PSE5_BH09PSE5_13610 [soil metagenome]
MKTAYVSIAATTAKVAAIALFGLSLTAIDAQAQGRHGGGPGRGFSGSPGHGAFARGGPAFRPGPVFRPAPVFRPGPGPGYYRPGGYYRGGGWGPGVFWGGLGLGIGVAAASSYYYPAPYGYPSYYAEPIVTQVVPASPGYVIPGAPQDDRAAAPQAQQPLQSPQSTTAPNPIFYPRQGQSAAQTEDDRQDCNRWATTQQDAMSDASVFQRAVLACMDGRGYTVR